MKQNAVLITSIVLGIAAALLSWTWIQSKEREYKQLETTLRGDTRKIRVVGAVRDLPKGTVIEVSDLVRVQEFESALGSQGIMEEDYLRIVGRKMEHAVGRGKPILWSSIEGGQLRYRGLSHDIRPGMRAASIAVSGAPAVSGMVRPNDTVDVLGTFVFSKEDAPDAAELVTLTVLQNVTVLATGSETAKTLDPMQRSSGGYSAVTLEVTPREAEVLVFAQQMKGRLALTLRNPTDVHFERELPRVDFDRIEAELRELNEHRQRVIRGTPLE